jgi:hypothetical protein
MCHRRGVYRVAIPKHRHKNPKIACELGLARQRIEHSMECLSHFARRCCRKSGSMHLELRVRLFSPRYRTLRGGVEFHLDGVVWRYNGDWHSHFVARTRTWETTSF